MYSYSDHSFATWNSQTGEYKRVNLISKGSNINRHGTVNPDERYEHTNGPLAKDCILNDKSVHYKSLSLHPGIFGDSFPYMIAVSKHDKITIRKFQVVDGYSCPIVLDEEKPGIKGFDCCWTKDGTVITYQVARVRDQQHGAPKSLQVGLQMSSAQKKIRPVGAPRVDVEMLGSEMDDFDIDDGTTVAGTSNVKYCIQKEEYPPELLRTFDIV